MCACNPSIEGGEIGGPLTVSFAPGSGVHFKQIMWRMTKQKTQYSLLASGHVWAKPGLQNKTLCQIVPLQVIEGVTN